MVAAAVGASIDLRTGRIPNVLTFTTALGGLAAAALGITHLSVWLALAGLALGLGFMLPGYVLGGSGAGDVKLMAAAGAWLGPERIVVAFLASAIAGGALAVWHAQRRGRMGVTVTRTARLVSGPVAAKAEIDAGAALTRFAYGPAIALGVLVAALWR